MKPGVIGGEWFRLHGRGSNVQTIQSVERAFNLLEVLARHPEGIGVTDLARKVGLNKTTAYRLLATMQGLGYVRRSQAGSNYTLGWRIADLASFLLEGTELIFIAREPLRKLSRLTREAVHLGVLEGNEVVYVSKIESPQPIRIASRVGGRMPVHCTALGKSILSHLPRRRAEEILRRGPLTQRTALTKTDPKLILQDLDEIRDRGHALDAGENEKGILCIGAPIFDNSGTPVAAVSISGPGFRLTEDVVNEMAAHVEDCAREISEGLGFDRENLRTLSGSS